MSIIYHKNTRIFHLTNSSISYVIRIMENGQAENLYYGKKIHDREGLECFHEEAMRSHLAVALPEPSILSMQYTRQEYPGYGRGDYRSPAFVILQESGSRISDFTYVSHRIEEGKPSLAPLPATYAEDPSEAQTLTICFHDDLSDTDLDLVYTIYRDYPVITRHARISQKGPESVTIERAMSASVELPDKKFEMIRLTGAWARERYIKTTPLEVGIQAVHSLTGTGSSAEANPFLALQRPGTTESAGEVYGFSLVYSGNFLAQTEVSSFDLTRVMLGINPESFAWKLESGESFTTPEAVMVYSDQGLGHMSRVYHRLYRTRLVRGVWRDRPRPILLNNWEGTYFDFDENKLLEMASRAAEAGIELFVLDDGWFGKRNDDYAGLGDWFCNMEKIPSGISGLSEKIEALGLKFGLWVELEMINKDSDLYRAHPDWLIACPGRFESHSRHQHVLDFTRKEVVDHIYEMICRVIDSSRISYIKWDMNRYMTEPFSVALPADRQGEVMHRYILGVYDLYTRLTERFPEILFESCASGGARFDPGMLYFAPQAWTSDDTDAYERCKIQYGSSLVYPVVSMGAHVSAVPNHQLARTTPIETRAAVAMFGTFGYELDPAMLSDYDIEIIKGQTDFVKKYRDLIQIDGDFYRLLSPFEGNETAFAAVSRDKKRAVATFVQRLNKVNASWLRLRFAGLAEDVLYRVSHQVGGNILTTEAYGDELMYAGLPIDREELLRQGGDFAALVFTLEAKEA